MKKLLTSILVLLPVLAWAQTAKNKISMVTYFPVPYVAYSRLNVTNQLDVGLTSGSCKLDLGCSTLTGSPLTVTSAGVLLNSGNLTLDGDATGTKNPVINAGAVSLGNGNGSARLSFNNLRANTMTGAVSINTPEAEANQVTLFGKALPSCKAKQPASNGAVAWQRVALGPNSTKNETYLVCGTPEGCESPKPEAESAVCQSGDGNRWEYTAAFGIKTRVCGLKTREKKCDFSTSPPSWVAGSTWDTSGCFLFQTTEKENCAASASQWCVSGQRTKAKKCSTSGPTIGTVVDDPANSSDTCKYYVWRLYKTNVEVTSRVPCDRVDYHYTDECTNNFSSKTCTAANLNTTADGQKSSCRSRQTSSGQVVYDCYTVRYKCQETTMNGALDGSVCRHHTN